MRRFCSSIVMLALFTHPVPDVVAIESEIPAWQEKLEQLQHLRNTLFDRLEDIRSCLAGRAQSEEPALLTRISPDPVAPRASGYGLLPEILENEPLDTVVPRQTVYSMRWVEDRLLGELEKTERLSVQLSQNLDLEPLVSRFEDLLEELRHLEDHLSYHGQWQRSVTEYPEYYREKSALVAQIREIEALRRGDGADARLAGLSDQLMQEVVSFRPTPGLALEVRERGDRVLPVTVCTDIEDAGFLLAYQQGVDEAFNQSAAARARRFSVELNWRLTHAEDLYPEGAPGRGDTIDIDLHLSLFKDCPLILTTGASTTHAMTGERIVLGTDAVSRRTLAHEFGHLLGFNDAYLRGYDGDPADEYGVVLVEWVDLTDDLMGSPSKGEVSSAMIERLVTAY